MRRRLNKEDLRTIDREELDVSALKVEIDDEDLTPPDWDSLAFDEAVKHHNAMWDKYFGDGRAEKMSEQERVAIYGVLSLNEHPVMRARSDGMQLRL